MSDYVAIAEVKIQERQKARLQKKVDAAERHRKSLRRRLNIAERTLDNNQLAVYKHSEKIRQYKAKQVKLRQRINSLEACVNSANEQYLELKTQLDNF